MFQNGQGVARDYPQALKWYGLAAKQGHVGARKDLGLIYSQLAASEKNIWTHLKAEMGMTWPSINWGSCMSMGTACPGYGTGCGLAGHGR